MNFDPQFLNSLRKLAIEGRKEDIEAYISLLELEMQKLNLLLKHAKALYMVRLDAES